MFGPKTVPSGFQEGSCDTCVYWLHGADCHRNAPSATFYGILTGAMQGQEKTIHEGAIWPSTRALEWCGEYRHDPNKRPDRLRR